MKTIVEQLIQRRDQTPDQVAVRLLTPSKRQPEASATAPAHDIVESAVTYAEWLGRAAATAAVLRKRDVQPGDRVLLSLPPSVEFLAAFLGAQWMGAVPVPLPSMAGLTRKKVYLSRVIGVCRDAAPAAILADDRTSRLLAEHGVSTPAFSVSSDQATATAETMHVSDPSHPAFIQYTSGSTGRPKGVVVTHGNLSANVAASVRAARFDHRDRFLSWLPVYHDLGLIGGILVPTTQGAVSHLLPPESFLLDPASWLHAVTRYRATVIMAPNFAYSLVARRVRDADLDGVDLSSVRLAFNGAEPVDLPTAEAFMQRMVAYGFSEKSYYPVYGLAETTLSATFPPVDRGIVVDHVRREDVARRVHLEPVDKAGPGVISSVSVGRVFHGHELHIVDPDGDEDLGERRLGEIVLSGPSISPHYFDKSSQPDTRRQLRTGDLGYLADGELYVVDRLKDLVIVAGACYCPSDIEQVVERVPGVRMGRSVAMASRVSDTSTDSLVVIAEARVTRRRTRRALQRAIRRAVSEQIGLVAEEVVLVWPRTLELTSSGKLMRAAARERYRRDRFGGDVVEPSYHPKALLRNASELVMKARAIWPRLRSN